jgi:hypothetical protein
MPTSSIPQYDAESREVQETAGENFRANECPPNEFFREQETAWVAQCEAAEKVIPFDRATRAKQENSPRRKPVVSICMADVEREEVQWLWWPYIPFGKCTVVDGDPGQGKSFLCAEIAARLSQGQKLPDMKGAPEPVTTFMLASEDGTGDTIRPRLDGCKADVKRIFLLKKNAKNPLRFDTAGLQTLKGEIERLGARLVSIDQLNSYLPADTRITDNAKMRELIDSLALLAEQTGGCNRGGAAPQQGERQRIATGGWRHGHHRRVSFRTDGRE